MMRKGHGKSRHRRSRRSLLTAVWPILVLTVCAFLTGSGCKRKKPPPPPPPEVLVEIVQPRDVPIYKEWIGTLDGLVNAQIRAQVTGYLLSQKYAEGEVVKKGDLLFEIDPRPLEAALQQTQAKL